MMKGRLLLPFILRQCQLAPHQKGAGIITRGQTPKWSNLNCCYSTASGKDNALDLLVILGSTRVSTPPRPARVGERVAKFCQKELEGRNHRVTLIDPLAFPSLSTPTFTPLFSYSPSKAPADLKDLSERIKNADGYVMVTPEYNHSMSPALAHLLNHFPSSIFGFKPSAIVSYSAGQWGGSRAATSLRPFLSELGCLPVSAMTHFPKAAEILSQDGEILSVEDAHKWQGYCTRSFAQLEWWAKAAKAQKNVEDPFRSSPAFQSSPSQRNAPTK
mmetsp:Transcript_9966/g.11427  ORF Transcript_9966/g.11427 Transcript_9966/m.11427 type:complete len:273 (+) Transcript_9966:501-1319(+)